MTVFHRKLLCAGAMVVLCLCALAPPVTSQGPDDPSPHSDALLVAEVTAIRPGEPFTVALRLTMDEGWHSYWIS